MRELFESSCLSVISEENDKLRKEIERLKLIIATAIRIYEDCEETQDYSTCDLDMYECLKKVYKGSDIVYDLFIKIMYEQDFRKYTIQEISEMKAILQQFKGRTLEVKLKRIKEENGISYKKDKKS